MEAFFKNNGELDRIRKDNGECEYFHKTYSGDYEGDRNTVIRELRSGRFEVTYPDGTRETFHKNDFWNEYHGDSGTVISDDMWYKDRKIIKKETPAEIERHQCAEAMSEINGYWYCPEMDKYLFLGSANNLSYGWIFDSDENWNNTETDDEWMWLEDNGFYIEVNGDDESMQFWDYDKENDILVNVADDSIIMERHSMDLDDWLAHD